MRARPAAQSGAGDQLVRSVARRSDARDKRVRDRRLPADGIGRHREVIGRRQTMR